MTNQLRSGYTNLSEKVRNEVAKVKKVKIRKSLEMTQNTPKIKFRSKYIL